MSEQIIPEEDLIKLSRGERLEGMDYTQSKAYRNYLQKIDKLKLKGKIIFNSKKHGQTTTGTTYRKG